MRTKQKALALQNSIFHFCYRLSALSCRRRYKIEPNSTYFSMGISVETYRKPCHDDHHNGRTATPNCLLERREVAIACRKIGWFKATTRGQIHSENNSCSFHPATLAHQRSKCTKIHAAYGSGWIAPQGRLINKYLSSFF